MAYYFFLGTIPLPVTPGALTVKTPSQNKTVTLINDGEINILKDQGLRDISFEFLLPQQKYPFANYSISSYTATTMIPVINQLKKSKKPFQFIVTRMNPRGKVLFFTNITCQIEDFEYDEDANEHGLDVMCKISLKEWKSYGTKSITISNVNEKQTGKQTGKQIATKKTARPSTKVPPKIITVKKGDTLWGICKKHLGSGIKYKEVAKLNKLSNPHLIFPGQKIRLS